MLSDERGGNGDLPRGRESHEIKGASYDELFKQYQREDNLWSARNVHEEEHHVGDDAVHLMKALNKAPTDLAYSSYHRHSQLESLLHYKKERRWDPLDGIERYWQESKAEARASGDFENHRLSNHQDHQPKEGHVRIVVPISYIRTQNGPQGPEPCLGLQMNDLRVTAIVDPQAYECGWRMGDFVEQINRSPIYGVAHFKQAFHTAFVRNKLAQAPIIFDVWRDPTPHLQQPFVGMVNGTLTPDPPPRTCCDIWSAQNNAAPFGPPLPAHSLPNPPFTMPPRSLTPPPLSMQPRPQWAIGSGVPGGPPMQTVPPGDLFLTRPMGANSPPGITMGGPGSERRMGDLMRENMLLKQELARHPPGKKRVC